MRRQRPQYIRVRFCNDDTNNNCGIYVADFYGGEKTNRDAKVLINA